MTSARPERASFEWPAAQRQTWREASHGDASFARALPRARDAGRTPASPAPEIAFLASSGIHPAILVRKSAEARRLGVSADAALLAERIVDDAGFYRALARHFGAPFSERDLRLAPGLDSATAAIAGVAPLERWPGGPRWVFAPRGRQIADLPRAGLRDCVITTPRHFESLLRKADAARIAEDASFAVERAAPGLSARSHAIPGGWPALAAIVALVALAMWIDSGFALALAAAFLWTCFAASCFQRLLALFASFEPMGGTTIAQTDEELPPYTIIVALYREAHMARDLIAAIERLDYPRAKLDVKFVVEADDPQTRHALVRRLPGVEYEVIVAPPGTPRTKPRALNVALPFARGDLLAIFDAEDRPDPMQLRKAAAAFAQAPRDVACFQARLAIDNGGEGPLQALYALDYAALFGVSNRGLAYCNLPIFLGGTSNHFRRDCLVEVGAWDAWNVTEDADLGLRLARYGFRVAFLDSWTDEEAPTTFRSFFRQRTRWMKGWLQTLIVHLRDPRRLWRDLGAQNAMSVLAMFASGVIGPLVWPLFAVGVAWHAWFGVLLEPVGPVAVARSTLTCLLVACGLVAMIAPLVVGAIRQGLRRYLLLLPLLPVWYLALSVSAWMAFFELFSNPYRWAKTDHGFARRRMTVSPVAPPAE